MCAMDPGTLHRMLVRSIWRDRWPFLVAGLAMLVQMIAQVIEVDHGDFPVFVGAAEHLNDGLSPYLTWLPTRNGHALQFVYPPLSASVFTPFTWMPRSAAYVIWFLIRVALSMRILKLMLGQGSAIAHGWKRTLFTNVVLAVFLRFALDDIALGQWTIVLLFLAVEGVHRLQQGSSRTGAFLIALGASLKLLPLVLLVGLARTRKWRALTWTVVFGILFTALPILHVGPTRFVQLMIEWSHALDPKFNPDISDTGGNNKGILGLSGMLPAYWPAAGDGAIGLVLNGLRVLLLMGALRFSRRKGSDDRTMFAYLLLIAPLIFPHQQSYAFLFVTPAVVIILNNLLSKNSLVAVDRWALGLLAGSIALLVGSAHIILGPAGHEFATYAKFITWGAMLLVPAMMLTRRKMNE